MVAMPMYALQAINKLEKGSLNLQYKKTADSVLLSLFTRTIGKCNDSHAH